MAPGECRGELLGQSRRGALTDAGRLALDAHLAACASCRLSRDVLADFDQVDVVDIRDGARVRALVDTARQLKGRSTAAGRARSPRRLRAAAAAAALIVCGGSASAAVWLWRRPAPAPASVAAAATRTRVEPPRTFRTAVAAPLAAPVESPPAESPPSPARHRVARGTAAAGDPHVSAAALLAEAGRARGEGQSDRAVSLYRRLQHDYPGTPEALVSTVPLGRLLLDGGAPVPARLAFDSYLRDVPRGPLVAEALYGRGRALERQGDSAEELRTWQRLVAEHADSAYVSHARRRIAALR